MPLNGVKTTGIILRPVLFRNMLMDNVRTDSLIINNVKLIISGLAVIPVIQTPVLPGKSLRRIPDAVLMILLTVPVVGRVAVRVIRP